MHLAVFLRAPNPREVKTRLSPPLTPEDAAELYAVFVQDTLDTAARTTASCIWLVHEGPRPREYLPAELLARLDDPPGRLREQPQSEGDLGHRLEEAMRGIGNSDGRPVLVVGSDHPDLPLLHLNRLMAALAGAELVVGEASDGGAWGIGLREARSGLFEDIPWSTRRARAALVARAGELELSCRILEPWHDVDDFADLKALWHRLAEGRSQAPRSYRWLQQWPSHHLLSRTPS